MIFLNLDLDEMDRLEKRSDELYAELRKKRLNNMWLYDRVLDNAKEAVEAMYFYTAGEIEARDVTSRHKMSTEERRNRMPDLGDENTVLAEGDGENAEIDPTYKNQIEEWYKSGMPEGETFTLGSTGATLQSIGAIESDINITGDKIKTILEEHPEMTFDEIKRIPKILEDPAIVLKSKNIRRAGRKNTRIVMSNMLKAKNGKQIMIVLNIRPINDKGMLFDDLQKAGSSYTKETKPVDFIRKSEILFADKKEPVRFFPA